MLDFLRWAFDRGHEPLTWISVKLKDPRTWTLLTPILGSLGVTVNEGLQRDVMFGVALLTGALAILTAYRKDREAKRVQEALAVKVDGDLGKKTVAAAVEATAAKDVLTGPNPAM